MPKDNEVDEKVPVYVATAPERIFLQVADDAYYAEDPFPAEEEVTWCADSVMELEVSYVREDLHAATVAELRAEVKWVRGINSSLVDKCNRLNLCGAQSDQRADAAERRVGELEAFLRILWEEYEHAAEYMGEGCLGVDPYRRSQFEALTGADPT